jgi:hypothetical protein
MRRTGFLKFKQTFFFVENEFKQSRVSLVSWIGDCCNKLIYLSRGHYKEMTCVVSNVESLMPNVDLKLPLSVLLVLSKFFDQVDIRC